MKGNIFQTLLGKVGATKVVVGVTAATVVIGGTAIGVKMYQNANATQPETEKVVQLDTQTEIETESAKETITETEEVMYPIDMTAEYTQQEMDMLVAFVNGISDYNYYMPDQITDSMAEEVSDYQKLLIYYFMMIGTDFRGLDSFEQAGLVKETGEQIEGYYRNGYSLTEQEMDKAQTYIWKSGLSNLEASNLFLNEVFKNEHNQSIFSKVEDNYIITSGYLEHGYTDVDNISVSKVSKNTFYIDAQTGYDDGSGDDNKVTSYLRLIAEENTESPFLGMTITRVLVFDKPNVETPEYVAKEVNWIQAYKNFLKDGRNFVSILTGEDDDYRVGTQIVGFVLYDINQDNIPELLISKNDIFNVYIYSYSKDTEKIEFYGSRKYHINDIGVDNETWGFDSQTGNMYIYSESAEDDCSLGEVGSYSMSLECISIFESQMYNAYHWIGRVDASEMNKINSRFSYESDSYIPFVDAFTDTNSKLSDTEAKVSINSFIPFEWHRVEAKEIEKYVCADYQKQNLNVKVDYSKKFINDHDLKQIGISYNNDEALKDINTDKMVTLIKWDNHSTDFYYMDLERLCIFDCIWGEVDLDSTTAIEVNAPDGYVNLRIGPGTNYPVITSIKNGNTLKVYTTDEDEKWGGVWYNDAEHFGWVSLSQCKQEDEITQRVFTDEELQIIKEWLGVPAELKATFEIGDSYYYEGAGCWLTRVSVYTEYGYASGTFDDDLELYSTYAYTEYEEE